jgi:hypothetical protein
MALMPLKGSFLSGAWRWMAPIISGQIFRSQRDAIATSGAVVIVALQRHEGNARLRTTLGASYKCFTSCHTCISFLLRACARPEKVFSFETHSRREPPALCVRNQGLDFKASWYDF